MSRYHRLFQNFQKNLNRFSEEFVFHKTAQTKQALQLCQKYVDQLDAGISEEAEKHRIYEHLHNMMFRTIHSLGVYREAPSRPSDQDISEYEQEICRLCQQETFKQEAFNALYEKRMLSHEAFNEICNESGITDIAKPLFSAEEDDWGIPSQNQTIKQSLPKPIRQPQSTKREIILSESIPERMVPEEASIGFQNELDSVLVFLEGLEQPKAHNERYHNLLAQWDNKLRCDEEYFERVQRISQLKQSLPKNTIERNNCTFQAHLLLTAFFANREGYADIPGHFLETAQQESIYFSDEELLDIRSQIKFIREGAKTRLTVNQLLCYSGWIHRYGKPEERTAFNDQYRERVQYLADKQVNGQSIFFKRGREVLPRQIKGLCKIPERKPFFLRRDRRRQYHMAQMISAAYIVLDAAEARIRHLAEKLNPPEERSEQQVFKPDEGLALLQQLLDECKFLEEQYKSQQHQFSPKGLFLSGSRKLGQAYQGALLETLQSHYQKIYCLCNDTLGYFQKWAGDRERDTQRHEVKNHLKKFKKIDRDIATYLQENKNRLETYNQQLSPAQETHGKWRIHIMDTEFIFQDSADISNQLSQQPTEETTQPEDEAGQSIAPDHPEVQIDVESVKQGYLQQSIERGTTPALVSALLLSNAAANPMEIQEERVPIHERFQKRVEAIVGDIRQQNVEKYISQKNILCLRNAFKYFQSIQDTDRLDLFRRMLNELVRKHLQEEQNESVRAKIQSLLHDFPSQETTERELYNSVQSQIEEAKEKARQQQEAFRKLLQSEEDDRVKGVFSEIYKMIFHPDELEKPTTDTSALITLIIEPSGIESYMESRERFEQYIEQIKLATDAIHEIAVKEKARHLLRGLQRQGERPNEEILLEKARRSVRRTFGTLEKPRIGGGLTL